jgi:large subunit ribosomal protein L21
MYAVIRTGGKQYRVAKGDVLDVEHLRQREGTATFTPILVVGDDGKTIYGARELKPYTVTAKVVGETKGEKTTAFKYRQKTGYASKSGHRQLYSTIEILSIGPDDSRAPAGAPPPADAAPAAAPPDGAQDTGAPAASEATAAEPAPPAAGGAEAGTS